MRNKAFTDAEYHELQALVKDAKVLQMGGHNFWAAARMAFAAARVDCCYLADEGNDDTSQIADFLDYIRPYGDTVYLHIGKSSDIVPQLRPDYDVVFIDGSYSYEGTLVDLGMANIACKYGGQFAFADYGENVVKAIEGWLDQHLTVSMVGSGLVEKIKVPINVLTGTSLGWLTKSWDW